MADTIEDLRLRLEALRAEKARRIRAQQQTAETVGRVREAQDEAGLQQSRVSLLKQITKQRAYEGANAAPIAQAFGVVTGTPEENAAVERQLQDMGALQVGRQPGAPVAGDIEGALKRGGREIVANDQRLVVDQLGAPMATRDEYPSIGAHWDALTTKGGGGSLLGFAGNLLSAPSRAAATGLNYVDARTHGEQTGGVRQALRDMAAAFTGRSGDDVSPLAARRDSGFGDYFRAHAQRLLKENPNATFGDLIHAGVLVPDYIRDRPLSDLEDADYAFTGETAALGADPLNYVGGTLAKGAGKGLGFAGRVADKALPAAITAPVKVVGGAVAEGAMKALGADVLGPGKRWLLKRRLVAAGVDAASAEKIAQQAGQAVVNARAQEALSQGEKIDELQRAADMIDEKDAATVNALLEGGDNAIPQLRDLEEGPALLRLRDAARAKGAGLSTAEQAMLAPLEKLSALDEAVLANRAIDPNRYAALVGGDDLRLARAHSWDLARRLETDLFAPHTWEGVPARAQLAGAAKVFGSWDRRAGQELKRAQLIRGGAPLEGYIPHAPKTDMAAKLEKAGPIGKALAKPIEAIVGPLRPPVTYNPLRPRAMVKLENLDQLRGAADEMHQALKADPSLIGKFATAEEAEFLKRFATSPRFQMRPGAARRAKVVLTRLQGQTPPELVDTIDVAGDLLASRHGPEVAFEKDPLKARAAHAAFTGPAVARAKVGQSIDQITDAAGKRISMSLEEALQSPRLAVDQAEHAAMLQHRLEGGKLKPGQFFMGEDRLPTDVSGYLDKQGLRYISSTDVATRDVWRKMPALRGKVMPTVLADEVKKLSGSLEAGAFERFASMLGRINNLWAPIVLNTPGFHIRNWLYNEFQTYLAIGDGSLNPILRRAAHAAATVAEGNKLTDEVLEYAGRRWRAADVAALARKYGVVETGRTADVERLVRGNVTYKDQWGKRALQKLNPASNRALLPGMTEPLFKRTVNRSLGRLAGVGGTSIAGKGATVDNTQRMMVFLHELGDGKSALEAANTVRKFLFDYTGSSLSTTEKGLRKLMPFYQWLKFSTIQVVEQMVKQPQKYAQINHLMEMADAAAGGQQGFDPREKPEHLIEQGSVLAPDAILKPLGAEQSTKRRWYLAPQRPGAELNFLEPLVRGQPAEFIGEKVAPQFGPALGMGIERMTGNYLHGDTPISPSFNPDDASNTFLEDALGMESADMPGYLVPKLGSIAALGGQIAGMEHGRRWKSTDEGERLKFQGLSMATGFKLSPTSPAAVAKGVQAKAEQIMRSQGLKKRSLSQQAAAPASELENWALPYLEDDE